MKLKSILSVLLAVLMLGSIAVPVLADAVEGLAEGMSLVPSHMTITQDKESTLAPGVTQHEVALFDKNGDRVEMYVAIADMNVETVKLFASYKDMDPTNYGMSKLTEQIASFDKKVEAGDSYYQGTVVTGINSSYYNMITGKPTGTFVMNGIDVTTESEGNQYGYFAVMKDGSVKIGKPGDYSSDKGNIQEAIGIYRMLIIDGVVQNLDDVTKYPRQTIGITADNKVILMTADGNHAPDSIGLTLKEQAEVMEAMGCVWAGHLDGGGSATYVCKPEGEDDIVITNRPSDGSERSISNGFLIVSTAVASYSFDHVIYEAENEYMTPGTSVKVGVSGVSSTGNSADIPADITYVVENGTYVDGVFTAGSEFGSATITAIYNGVESGSVTLNVVKPETIAFNNPEMVVPYGKTVPMGITAKYGVNDVVIKASDFVFKLSDTTIGTISGSNFTAGAEGVAATESLLTATLVYNESLYATTTVKLGKGSEVVYDFEDGTNQKVIIDETPGTKYNYVWPESNQFISNITNGKVHSGSYAIGSTIDYSNSLESGYMKTSIYATETKVFENAVGIGVWIYIPDEFVGLWARWTLQSVTKNDKGEYVWGNAVNSNVMDTTAGGTGIVSTFSEPGWHYLYADTSAYSMIGWRANSAMIQLYISDRDGSGYKYTAADHSNIPGKYTIYLDDVTVDYSAAVDDREAPVFSNVTYATEGMADAAVLNGNTITTNKVTITASVAEYTGKSNFTGLDVSTVKAYVDGVEYAASYSDGKISLNDLVLDNGKHVIKFSACDNMGNYGYVYQYITVNAEASGSTIKLVPTDANLTYPKLGSIYNMDIVATAIEEVKSVEIVIDLDNNSTWQLDYMTVAEGFEATYAVEATENIATITITRTGKNTQTGEAALVTLPVRVWTLKTGYTYANGTKAGSAAFTLAQFKSMKEFWRMSVIANVDKGVLTRVDETVSTFTGDRVFCDTEMWGNYAAMSATADGLAYYNAWDGGHVHSAAAIEDKAATCTENGYTGRTFCEGCNSVVDWGTTVPATGHEYTVVDGVLKCECGEVFHGVYTDGKTYVDGIVAEGWVENSYFVDGVALTGVQKIDGYYYDFGENGVCANQTKYTGLFYNTELGAYSYSKVGVISTGWINIGENWHFFHGNGKAASGHYEKYFFSYGVTYDFEETGKLVTGVWHDRYINGELVGTMYFYGPSCYKSGWQEIDGEQYYFDGIYRAEGPHMIMESNSRKFKCFVFTEEGVLTDELYTGFVYTNDFLCYVEDNIARTDGMFKLGNDLYYAHHDGKLAVSSDLVTRPNGFVEGYVTYPFEANGRLYNGIYEEGGELHYYVNGVKMGRGVYYNEAGDYYVYVRSNGSCATGWYEVKANDVLEAGMRLFGEDGKMYTGVVEENGNLYFYRHGLKQGRGVHYVADGDYYVYVRSTGTCAVGYYEVKESAANGLLNPQYYMFGDDGKLLQLTGVMSVAGKQYYFINGAKQGRGLYYNEEGNYYVYVKSDETVATGRYYVNATNGLLPQAYYLFGEDGRTITGVVESNGSYYYYENGVQMGRGAYYNAEGDYYVYVRSNGICATGWYEVKANDVIDAGMRLFTDDGKTYTGIYEENGKLYYYYQGVQMGRGLYYNAEGDYYVYVQSNGTLATSRHYVNVTNDLLPNDYYNFGADGKLTF